MKSVTQKTNLFISRLTSMGGRVFILAAAFALLGSSIYVAQAQTSTTTDTGEGYHSKEAIEYCRGITPHDLPELKNLACQDGWDNTASCSDYEGFTNDLNDPTIVVDDVVGACETAKLDKDTCTKIANKEKVTRDPTRKCPKMTSSTDKSDVTVDDLLKDIEEGCAKLEKDGAFKDIDDNDTATKELKAKCDEKDKDDDDDSKSTDEKIEELREELEEIKKAAEPALQDNQYGKYVNGANKYQELRINRASGDNRPAIIFVNGGGWVADDGVGEKIAPHANERGYTTFVATYRLMSSGIYKQLDDITRAIQHIRNNAGMYGIDPNRIAILGDSAGGSLAVRAASTGKTGVKVQVGWSAPTNAYTGIFHSPRAFAAGMNHSTCAPTDLEGITDTLNELNGEEEDDSDTSSTDDSQASDNIALEVLNLAEDAIAVGESAEEISKKLETEEGQEELSGNARRLAAKKFLECIDNFNTASPALFAKPGSPPGFFVGYDTDPLIHPGQAFQMRDKLRALGVPSDVMILPGVPGDVVPGENHLDYHEKFVGPTLDFIGKFLHPEN